MEKIYCMWLKLTLRGVSLSGSVLFALLALSFTRLNIPCLWFNGCLLGSSKSDIAQRRVPARFSVHGNTLSNLWKHYSVFVPLGPLNFIFIIEIPRPGKMVFILRGVPGLSGGEGLYVSFPSSEYTILSYKGFCIQIIIIFSFPINMKIITNPHHIFDLVCRFALMYVPNPRKTDFESFYMEILKVVFATRANWLSVIMYNIFIIGKVKMALV